MTELQLGITMIASDQSMNVIELATACEERGFSSLWYPEHTHIPVSRETAPPTGDAELPIEYTRTLDPLVAIAAGAAVTDSLRFGTGILLPAQREPIVTAKAIATIDHLAPGRFDLGIGFGWNVDEMRNHGVNVPTRRAQVRDHVSAMRALWSPEPTPVSSEHVHITPSWAFPKPASGTPRVFIGGAPGPKLLDAVADYADGWLPIGGQGIKDAIPALEQACERYGRDYRSLVIIPFGTLPNPGKLEYYASLGITEVVLRVSSGPREVVLPELDAHAAYLVR